MLPDINLKLALPASPGTAVETSRAAAEPAFTPVHFADILGSSVLTVTAEPARPGGGMLPAGGKDLPVPGFETGPVPGAAPGDTGPELDESDAPLPLDSREALLPLALPVDGPAAPVVQAPASTVAAAADDVLAADARNVRLPSRAPGQGVVGQLRIAPDVPPHVTPGPAAENAAWPPGLAGTSDDGLADLLAPEADASNRVPLGLRAPSELPGSVSPTDRIDDTGALPRPVPVVGERTALSPGAEESRTARRDRSIVSLSPLGSMTDLPAGSDMRQTLRAPDSTAAAATARLPAHSIGVPVQESGWDAALSDRVLVMAHNKLRNAHIQLSPAELGPLRIQLAVEDNTANVTFHAQHAVTRDAIEQALPRLRDMLAETGLQLGRCEVSDSGVHDRPSERQARGPVGTPSATPGQHDTDTDAPAAGASVVRASSALVDTFA